MSPNGKRLAGIAALMQAGVLGLPIRPGGGLPIFTREALSREQRAMLEPASDEVLARKNPEALDKRRRKALKLAQARAAGGIK